MLDRETGMSFSRWQIIVLMYDMPNAGQSVSLRYQSSGRLMWVGVIESGHTQIVHRRISGEEPLGNRPWQLAKNRHQTSTRAMEPSSGGPTLEQGVQLYP